MIFMIYIINNDLFYESNKFFYAVGRFLNPKERSQISRTETRSLHFYPTLNKEIFLYSISKGLNSSYYDAVISTTLTKLKNEISIK